jgi:hypothetical protein
VPKTITSSEFLPLLEKARGHLLDFSTGFVRPYTVRTGHVAGKPDRERFDAALGGSRTLVSAGDTQRYRFEKGGPGGIWIMRLDTHTGKAWRTQLQKGELNWDNAWHWEEVAEPGK